MEVFILCSVVWSILTPSVSVHRQQRAHPTEIKNMLRKLRIVNGFEKKTTYTPFKQRQRKEK